MNYDGLIVGAATFLLIGVFHVIVVRTEYYFSKKVWYIFLIFGLILLTSSLFIKNNNLSIIFAVTGICFLWSIKELFEQEERVKKGWFPKRKNSKNDNKA